MDEPNKERKRPARRRPPISNYYRSGASTAGKDSPFKPRVVKTSRVKKYLIRTIDALLVIGLVALLIHSLIVNPNPKVIVSDTSVHSHNNYQDSADTYVRPIRFHNKITFDTNAITADFKRDYPEVSAASVELPIFSQRPVIRLQVAPPAFYFKSGDKDYIVDANGYAVGTKQQYISSKLPEVFDQSGFTASLGKHVLSSQSVAFINYLVAQCNISKIKIKSLILPAAPAELDLHTVDQSYFVKFYLGGDAPTQVGQFLAARHDFAQKNTQPSTYLDVRVCGKIFYK